VIYSIFFNIFPSSRLNEHKRILFHTTMKKSNSGSSIFNLKTLACLVMLGSPAILPDAKGQNFTSSVLNGTNLRNPTSLDMGPDGKLYVTQQSGEIYVFTIERAGANNYKVTATEKITLVREIPNHNDDGTPAPGVTKRQLTGIHVAGTKDNPLIYVASSDSRIGASEYGDVNLCTNSGILSRLYKEGGQWKKIDLVRGLPRSEENHAPNGIQIDPNTNTLFLTIGGTTNSGGVSRAWTYITEYALSACILSIDLNAIDAMPTKDAGGAHPYKYDLPTLDDPTRPGNPDPGDPFGGNDGMNQAKIVSGGPVQVYSPGWRNAYDLLLSRIPGRAGNLYTIDNGPNGNWGGYPVGEGTSNPTNQYDPAEPGSTKPDANGNGVVANYDGLELIGNVATYKPGSYYGGHPVPIRANPSGAGLFTDNGTVKGWRNDNSNSALPLPSDWPPVPAANPVEGDYLAPGKADKSLITFNVSVNGFCEYTAAGSLYGYILAAGFDGKIYKIKLNDQGTALADPSVITGQYKLNTASPFASGLGKPLDVTAQGDDEAFPGTVWSANYSDHNISVFEPGAVNCTNKDDNNDDDGDRYTNADEIDNGTNPCSGADKPSDWDNSGVSDLNDPDDDNDGIPDTQDKFALDIANGDTTKIPTYYTLFNNDPGVGFFGLGFSGLMCNGKTDYISLFQPDNLVAGGAVGAFTIYEIPSGDALDGKNDQTNAFQFGVKTSSSAGRFYTVRTKLIAPFFNQNPKAGQSQGFFIGNGDQDNYLKMVLTPSGINVVNEVSGVSSTQSKDIGGFPVNSLELIFVVDKEAGTAQPYYKKDGTDSVRAGDPVQLSGAVLDAAKNILAVGAIATSGASGQPFDATWDFFAVSPGITITAAGTREKLTSLVNGYVYPSPCRDNLNLVFNSDIQRNIKVNLYDNSGISYRNLSYTIPSGKSDNILDVSDLTPGVYFLNMTADDGVPLRTLKIVKM
jgi:large repetitive protein